MHWYKTAKEFGHGDTFDGQLMKKELARLSREVSDLKVAAAAGGPHGVLPRWKPDVRRSIFLLPSVERMPMMSMYELGQVSQDIQTIRAAMAKYDAGHMMQIMGAQ